MMHDSENSGSHMRPLTSDSIRQTFGIRSALARQMIPMLVTALEQNPPHFQRWRETAVIPTARHLVKLGFSAANPAALLFALQTYYALCVKMLAAQRLGRPESLEAVETDAHFRQHGIHEFTGLDAFSWHLESAVDATPLLTIAEGFDYADSPPDALKALYQELFPPKLRHALGEYYTPDWMAELTLDRVRFTGEGRLLDPSCGSGTFLALALRRMQAAGVVNPLKHLAGIDVNPLACLAARANLVLALGNPDDDIHLPIHCADSVLNPPALSEFDFVVGNPPWVNWETLPPDYRQQTRTLWERYGLFPHSGMEAIMGKGKKDLALLLTYRSADAYLKHGGKLGFILTQSALKAGGASAGFRRFRLDDGMPLGVQQVDDLSRLDAFDGAATKAVLLVLEKGTATRYPLPYRVWKRTRRTRLHAQMPLAEIRAKTRRVQWAAAPLAEADSAWLTGHPAALDAVRRLSGESDYEAHAGVYTGGANAVYWLEVLERDGALVRVRNITAGAKRSVPQVEAWVEEAFVFPLLRGNEVHRWRAEPGVHILMVQDPERRRGYDLDWLRQHAPRTLAYLAQFEEPLRQRAAYRRYYKTRHPFYSMFDVGTYSFAPVKVVWKGFGTRRMQAAVLTQQVGKPIMTNQAMHPFIGLQDTDEAHYLAACLNSAPFEYAVLSQGQVGGKSFAQPGLLKLLRLPRYQAANPLHQKLARLSREAHSTTPDDAAIAEATGQLWSLTQAQQHEIRASLAELL